MTSLLRMKRPITRLAPITSAPTAAKRTAAKRTAAKRTAAKPTASNWLAASWLACCLAVGGHRAWAQEAPPPPVPALSPAPLLTRPGEQSDAGIQQVALQVGQMPFRMRERTEDG